MSACSAPNPLYTPRTDGGSETGGAGGSGGAPFGTGGVPLGTGGVPFGTGGFPFGTGGAPIGVGGAPLGTGGAPVGTGGVPLGTGGAGGEATDAFNPPPDLGSDKADATAETGPPVMGPSADQCGMATNDLAAITGARGLAIANDGSVYFARESGTQAWIGRVDPAGTLNASWLPLPNNSQPRALRMDNSRDYLYVAGSGASALYSVAVKAPIPAIVNTAAALPGAYGLAVAMDGSIFVSLSNGLIMRVQVDLSTARMQVSNGSIFPAPQRPLGLAFGPRDEHLYIGSSNGRVKRFAVRDLLLYDGVDHGDFNGAGNDLAVDIHGRIYVAGAVGTTPRHVTVIPPLGVGVSTTLGTAGLLGGLAFGRGSFSCQALYVSDAQDAVRRVTALGPGLLQP